MVCLSKNGNVTHQKLLDNNITFSCQSTSISYKGRCFCFHQCKSLECSTRNIVSVCKGRNLINVYGNDYVIPTLFRIIWEAVAINDITFAVINKGDKMLQYWNNKKSKRTWLGPISLTSSSHNKKDSAHFLCQSKKGRTKPNYEIMCRYTSGVSYVTLQFMCDIKNYCNGFTKKMDQNEFEYSAQKNADFICNSPIFLYKSIRGKFMPYSQQKIKLANVKEHRTVVPFKNNNSFEESTLNDLISDCGYHADDKAIHITVLMKETSHECSLLNQLSCNYGHSQCYNFGQMCIFRLNKCFHLIPCRTGSHFEYCKDFVCNRHLKCPGYYCIPWAYSCDGKWDCPDGYDESSVLNCGHQRRCIGMFSCKDSQLCLHLEDICDGNNDCPLCDDEFLCGLKGQFCVTGCTCYHYAIVCNISIINYGKLHKLPYVCYHLEFLELFCQYCRIALLCLQL